MQASRLLRLVAMNLVARKCKNPRIKLAAMLILSSLGVFAISFGLPVICYMFIFFCNDISGCPVPSLLRPSTLTINQLKKEAGWPDNGLLGLFSFKVTGYVMGYYLLSLILYRVLPGEEAMGTQLASGGRLKYKLNSTQLCFTVSVKSLFDAHKLNSFLILRLHHCPFNCWHDCSRVRLSCVDFYLGQLCSYFDF